MLGTNIKSVWNKHIPCCLLSFPKLDWSSSLSVHRGAVLLRPKTEALPEDGSRLCTTATIKTIFLKSLSPYFTVTYPTIFIWGAFTVHVLNLNKQQTMNNQNAAVALKLPERAFCLTITFINRRIWHAAIIMSSRELPSAVSLMQSKAVSLFQMADISPRGVSVAQTDVKQTWSVAFSTAPPPPETEWIINADRPSSSLLPAAK